MATIRDVSKLAGVSVATVSRVINQKGYVHEDTLQRVHKAIKLLNYVPNDVARSLSKKSTKTIALFVPDITNPFFNELALAVEKVTQLYGYTTILCNTNESAKIERQYIQNLKQKYIDGFIMATNTLTEEEIDQLDIPMVAVDRSSTPVVPTVTSKNRDGAHLAVQALLQQGCNKIAHIRGPKGLWIAEERCQGYLDLVENMPWFTPKLIANGNFQLKEAAEAAKKLFKEHPDIDGVFAGNDLMAIGTLRALQEHGIRVPDQVQIIGYDGISLAEMVYPELSTVSQSIYEMGMLAARILIKKIEQIHLDEENHQLEVKLVQRGTTRHG
ncbi:LacI family transcriptional regulator [Paenibacillus chitinolyticus]|uniref:LacI family transcriptional regulator n=1 Tax=Paenibacillus chitinolyticus TaxID=79263 RepID=A0A410WZ84_9BACL|nr:LacI family DNA-binding transcriptional regulator [Paenibacillus chitinolyticus]MCY9590350.1 LacI family transcriptional regulator [Paenibacillus chitinolyticus]MCY9596656.1 LacI family transcriptional regulator [Paenibacillus chitinolyticus]QAV19660.1 LacI family transcriptional regulator [Paenibacillus chitinolyticus]